MRHPNRILALAIATMLLLAAVVTIAGATTGLHDRDRDRQVDPAAADDAPLREQAVEQHAIQTQRADPDTPSFQVQRREQTQSSDPGALPNVTPAQEQRQEQEQERLRDPDDVVPAREQERHREERQVGECEGCDGDQEQSRERQETQLRDPDDVTPTQEQEREQSQLHDPEGDGPLPHEHHRERSGS